MHPGLLQKAGDIYACHVLLLQSLPRGNFCEVLTPGCACCSVLWGCFSSVECRCAATCRCLWCPSCPSCWKPWCACCARLFCNGRLPWRHTRPSSSAGSVLCKSAQPWCHATWTTWIPGTSYLCTGITAHAQALAHAQHTARPSGLNNVHAQSQQTSQPLLLPRACSLAILEPRRSRRTRMGYVFRARGHTNQHKVRGSPEGSHEEGH